MDNSNKKPLSIRLVLFYLVGIALLGSFLVGYYSGQTHTKSSLELQQELTNESITSPKVYHKTEKPAFLKEDVDFTIYWDLWNLLQRKYVNKPVEEPLMFYGSLEGMVASLGDPYTVFLNPEMAKLFDEELKGNFEGIGAEVGIRKGLLTVIAPLDGSPAEKAGLRAGDIIIAIDDKDTLGVTLGYAVSMIRGHKGTDVVLTIFREGFEEPQDFTVTRDEINVKSVKW